MEEGSDLGDELFICTLLTGADDGRFVVVEEVLPEGHELSRASACHG